MSNRCSQCNNAHSFESTGLCAICEARRYSGGQETAAEQVARMMAEKNAEIVDLRKQLSERDELLLELRKHIPNITNEVQTLLNDPRWPTDSSSRSSTKEEPKA